VERALSTQQLAEETSQGRNWDQLSAWVPFHKLLEGFDRAQATPEQATALIQGKQHVLSNILKTFTPSPLRRQHHSSDTPSSHIAIYSEYQLIAVACQTHGEWGLERVFPLESGTSS
jgi:hypothetical protein